jgi:hypothetical protein
MNNEISEEAKKAIADLPRRKALQRLERDGATSTKAVQRRVRAIAEERNIPPADFAKLMHKRISITAIGAFCEKYKISYDWLLCGDLQGLAHMEQRRKDAEAVASHPGGAQGYFLKIFCGLDERHQETVISIVPSWRKNSWKVDHEAPAPVTPET